MMSYDFYPLYLFETPPPPQSRGLGVLWRLIRVSAALAPVQRGDSLKCVETDASPG